jgi:hypothetical protein
MSIVGTNFVVILKDRGIDLRPYFLYAIVDADVPTKAATLSLFRARIELNLP